MQPFHDRGEASKKVFDTEVLRRARKWGEGEEDDDIIHMGR